MMRSGSSQADDQLPDLAGILGKLGERSQTSRGLKRGGVSAFHGWNVAGISPKAADVRPISTSIFLCRMAQSCALAVRATACRIYGWTLFFRLEGGMKGGSLEAPGCTGPVAILCYDSNPIGRNRP